ncbi:hypothetical protein [Oxynema aestuarii]|uniref:Uncharacterized protein n=1 Tax=Oxynema aestuarii AP17 TaxID=2064643 RepID=A0A6H1TT45_9CYAN|nr:hypothetical protein [Oxynema aestuarii]QIZ69317.1 hypothetical protein HCG48_00870 [Oxynema aestuarii AP17]
MIDLDSWRDRSRRSASARDRAKPRRGENEQRYEPIRGDRYDRYFRASLRHPQAVWRPRYGDRPSAPKRSSRSVPTTVTPLNIDPL